MECRGKRLGATAASIPSGMPAIEGGCLYYNHVSIAFIFLRRIHGRQVHGKQATLTCKTNRDLIVSQPSYGQPQHPGQHPGQYPGNYQQPYGVQEPAKKSSAVKILLIILIPILVLGLLCIGLLVALLVPAVGVARQAAARALTQNQLRQVSLGLLTYESMHQQFPYSSKELDENGKPLLSWRVHILPAMGYSDLYQEFHLDEPWDSTHNMTLVKEMPDLYRVPAVDTSPGSTVIRAISRDDGMIPYGPGVRLASITDGASNTVLTVIANRNSEVPWTSPEPFDNQFSSLHRFPNDVIVVGFADGAVVTVSAAQPQDVWDAVTGRADNIPKSFQSY